MRSKNMKCSHDPRKTTGPIGMYHCPECGEMVVAGVAHPDYGLFDLRELISSIIFRGNTNNKENDKIADDILKGLENSGVKLEPSHNAELQDAIVEMSKSIKCLALELPDTVWEDVNMRWNEIVKHLMTAQTAADIVDKIKAIREEIEHGWCSPSVDGILIKNGIDRLKKLEIDLRSL